MTRKMPERDFWCSGDVLLNLINDLRSVHDLINSMHWTWALSHATCETKFSSENKQKTWNWCWWNVWIKFNFFSYGDPNDPALLVERTIIFPMLCSPNLCQKLCLYICVVLFLDSHFICPSAHPCANKICLNYYSFIIKSDYPVELALQSFSFSRLSWYF